MHTLHDRALHVNPGYPPGCSAAAVSRAADSPRHVSVRSSLSDDTVVPVRLLETATDVIGVPGTNNCHAVLLDGRLVGLAIFDAHAGVFHAVNDKNERLPGSFTEEHGAADAVLDAREE